MDTDAWYALAARQGWVVGRAQLLGCGVPRHSVDRMLATGTLLRIQPGVYRLAGIEPTWSTLLWEKLLAAGPLSFAYRRSAAALWQLDGFDMPDDTGVHPEVGIARGRRAGRTSVHRLSGLRPGDVTRLGDVRISAPARTLLDLGTACAPDLVERAAECALRRGLVDEVALRDEVASREGQGHVRRRGGPVLRQVMQRRPHGVPPTESDAETRFLQLCRVAGVPEPTRQLALVLGVRVRLDFAWPAVRLACEIDGQAVHGPDALGPDLRRQNRIVLAGWRILRFTWQDVVIYPTQTGEVLHAAFRRAAAGCDPL